MSRMLILPHLDPGKERQTVTVDAGMTIAEMVSMAFPGLTERRHVRVVIGDNAVPQAYWPRVRPREGTTVIIRLIPGSDTLRSVLSVAVVVAAVALGQFYAPTLAGFIFPSGITGLAGAGATLAPGGVITALSTLGFTLAGTALLNALVPLPGLGSQQSGTSLAAITGLQNQANPGGVIPSILGRHRYAAPYAAPPYTEIIGDDQFVIAAFEFGHGPLNFYNHQLGDTPVSSFSDVWMEVRQGLSGDAPLSLYPQQVLEEQINALLEFGDGGSVRTTARDVTESSVDFTFMQGLVQFDDKGNQQTTYVQVRISQRPVGTVAWSIVEDFAMFGATQDLVRRTFRWTHPARGQYDILCERITAFGDTVRRLDKCTWSAIRSFRPESPFNYDKPTAKVALRIRASNQLNGIVNNYNAVPALVCKDWDAASRTWIVRETSNPASLARYVLQGPGNVRPKADSEIDLPALQDWHAFCVAKGLTYNRVQDYDATRREVLEDICRAGRAVPYDDGVKWSVRIDRPQSTYVAAITPRNSWDFQGSTPYVLFPDGHRIKFLDATNGWNQAERIVPFPGKSLAEVEVTEDMEHPGVTDPAQIWRATRRRQYELIHRPHSYSANQDWESMVLERMALAALNHDILDRDHVSARVKDVIDRTIVIDTPVTMEAGRSYAVTVRLANGSMVRRTVTTIEGDTQTLRVVGDLTGIKRGDLALFGTTIKGETIDVIIKNIERGDNLTAKLTAVDAAPIIDELTDAEVPPAWDGRVGGEVDVSDLVPAVPSVTVVGVFPDFVVTITPGTGSIAVPASYVISWRLHGGGAFTTIPIVAGTGVAIIEGFIDGDEIDVKAHAVSAYGVPSADTDIVQATMDEPTP